MTIAIPQTVATHPSERAALERDLQVLDAHKQAWAVLPPGKKSELFAEVKRATARVAERWVQAAVRAKGIPDGSPLAGEEWASGPWALLCGLTQYMKTLSEIAQHGQLRVRPDAVRRARNGQVVVDVFPASIYDRLLLSGISAEVWMEPSVSPENLGEHMGAFYRDPRPTGKVALVLGAGNVASIAPLDVLYKLVAEGQVCMLKMNPVNEYVGPFLEEAFRALIDEGFVRLVYGGGDVGAWLCEHPLGLRSRRIWFWNQWIRVECYRHKLPADPSGHVVGRPASYHVDWKSRCQLRSLDQPGPENVDRRRTDHRC